MPSDRTTGDGEGDWTGKEVVPLGGAEQKKQKKEDEDGEEDEEAVIYIKPM